MAYATRNNEKRINYYSNPEVKYKGYPTGTKSNNNALTLTEARFAVAQISDESSACPAGSLSISDSKRECKDEYQNCQEAVGKLGCWNSRVRSSCPESCGLCPVMSQHLSTTCSDKKDYCGKDTEDISRCWESEAILLCPASCGICPGTTTNTTTQGRTDNRYNNSLFSVYREKGGEKVT